MDTLDTPTPEPDTSDTSRFIRFDEPDVTTSQIAARFRLINLEEQRMSDSYQDSDGQWKTRHVAGCHIKFLAEQGGVFGNATPSVGMEMTIKDPDAARVFIQIWHRYLHGESNAYPAFNLCMWQSDTAIGWPGDGLAEAKG